MIKIGQFRWTRGGDVVRRWELPTADHYCTGFCPKCGSSMPWLSRNGKYGLVPAGSLDADPGQRPARSIYWDSRAPWYEHASTLPTVPEGP